MGINGTAHYSISKGPPTFDWEDGMRTGELSNKSITIMLMIIVISIIVVVVLLVLP